MALFGDDEGEVAPFAMAEDEEEEWFPFSLENLEMDRGCSPLPHVGRSYEEQDDGETDQDDDADGVASSPGPPYDCSSSSSGSGSSRFSSGSFSSLTAAGGLLQGPRGGEGGADRSEATNGLVEGKAGLKKQQQQQQQESGGGRDGGELTPPASSAAASAILLPTRGNNASRLVKVEAKTHHTAEKAKRGGSRGGGSSKSDPKRKHRAISGVGGMPTRSPEAPTTVLSWSTGTKGRNATTGGNGSSGGSTKATKNIFSSGSSSSTNGSSIGSTSSSGGSSCSSVATGAGTGTTTKGTTVQNKRRLERNAREQKRSLKISQRIEELRRMLSQFGVDVKTSKSAVLSEATDYIAHLQRQHAQFEAERARILQLLHNAKAAAAPPHPPAPTPPLPLPTSDGAAGSTTSSPAPSSRSTVKPPPSGIPQPRAHPFTAGSGAPGVGCEGARQIPEQWMLGKRTAVRAAAAGGAEIPASLSLSGSDVPPSGQKDAAGVAVATVSSPLSQSSIPVFRSMSAAARGGGEGPGSIPLSSCEAALMLPDDVMPAAMADGGSTPLGPSALVTTGASGAANVEATARALSHVNYERLFRTVPVPMAIANVNGNLVDCNARLTEATGFRREEALFMTIFDLVADSFLQHTFSMISSILNLRGVADPPFFQVLGKRRDGSPGGVVQISVVQDEGLRPLHFCICVMDAAAGAGGGDASGPGIVSSSGGSISGAGAGFVGHGAGSMGVTAGIARVVGPGNIARIQGNVAGP